MYYYILYDMGIVRLGSTIPILNKIFIKISLSISLLIFIKTHICIPINKN